jgi:hypothetical protein
MTVTQLGGVVCAIFGFKRGVRPNWECKGAWHGSCYKQGPKDDFPVLNQDVEAEDLISDDKMEDEDPGRFREGREADHLITPFQCDACHFENCKKRPPIEGNLQDEVAFLGIRRANLDALWSQERSTVRANRLQGKMWVSVSESAGWIDFGIPKRGPYPVEDSFGMQPSGCEFTFEAEKRRIESKKHSIRDHTKAAVNSIQFCPHHIWRPWGHLHVRRRKRWNSFEIAQEQF